MEEYHRPELYSLERKNPMLRRKCYVSSQRYGRRISSLRTQNLGSLLIGVFGQPGSESLYCNNCKSWWPGIACDLLFCVGTSHEIGGPLARQWVLAGLFQGGHTCVVRAAWPCIYSRLRLPSGTTLGTESPMRPCVTSSGRPNGWEATLLSSEVGYRGMVSSSRQAVGPAVAHARVGLCWP